MNSKSFIIGLVIGLIFGIGIGYLIKNNSQGNGSNTKEVFDFTPRSNKPDSLVAGYKRNGGEPISRGFADSIIGAFNRETDWFPLRVEVAGGSFQNLKGYWIGKQVFDDLLNPQKGNNGIRIYFAKKPDSRRRVFTMVVVGTRKADDNKTGDPNGNVDDPSQYYEEIAPCPTYCGQSGNK